MLHDFGSGSSLAYGFNKPEDGHVWSTFAFGMAFSPQSSQAVIFVHYPHEFGTLLVNNRVAGSRAYRLRRGANQLLVNYDASDTLCHFALSPRRALPSDVRELGLMVSDVWTASGNGSQAPEFPEANVGTPDPWVPLARRPANLVLARHLLESFIGNGFVMACIEAHDGVPRLDLALYLPPGERLGSTTTNVSINGKLFCIPVRQMVETADLMMPHLPNIALRCSIDLGEFVDQNNELFPLDIFVADVAGNERFLYQSFHWRGLGNGGIPAPEHILRIAGPASLNFILFTGATWYVKLVRLYEGLTGRSIDTCGPILDWGVGCARIARFFPEHLRGRVQGVDIDGFNIGWCRENIPGITFEMTTPSPPLPFTDGFFELVYGHSVITHLSEPDQHRWLRELARVLRVGGLCFITVLNEVSWFVRYYPDHRTPDSIAEFMETGFIDDGSVDVGVDAAEPGVYRNASHTTPYIRRVWSQYFEVVTIIQNFANLQSLVVLRRR